MSSLSTLPKGDSAWLLRKSIQRIMQQVSVLETNIGSSTTGNSANTQVIFNDNGTLRGDTGLTFNKTTDTLGTGRLTTSGDAIVCSSTGDFYVGTTLSPQFKVERATGSATITGDLTVDTSTLKVDSANDRVGVGTASPAQFVHLSKSNTSTALTAPPVGGASLRIQNTSSTNNNFGSVEFYNAAGLFGGSVNCQFTNQATPTNDLVFVTRGSSGGLEHYRIAADGVCTWSEVGGVAGTAMTLNSTGLGVGVAPNRNLDIRQDQSAATIARIQNQSVNAAAYSQFNLSASGNNWGILVGSSAANSNRLEFVVDPSGTNLSVMRLDTSGNVGIGVTPSAWGSGLKAFELGAKGNAAFSTANAIDGFFVVNNAYYDTAYKYGMTGYASRYTQYQGQHQFFTAPSGTVNTAITFTERLRLKETGQLRFVPLASDPSGAEAGDVYYNSSSNKLKCYNGTTWNDLF